MKKLLVIAILLSLVGMAEATRRHCGKKCTSKCDTCRPVTNKSCHKTCTKDPACCDICEPCCDHTEVICNEPQEVCTVNKAIEMRPCKKVVVVEDQQPWEVCQKTISRIHTSERCVGDCGSAAPGAPVVATPAVEE